MKHNFYIMANAKTYSMVCTVAPKYKVFSSSHPLVLFSAPLGENTRHIPGGVQTCCHGAVATGLGRQFHHGWAGQSLDSHRKCVGSVWVRRREQLVQSGTEKRKSGAEKRKYGEEKRKSGAEKRNCTLGPP